MIYIQEKRGAVNTSLHPYGIIKQLRKYAVIPLNISPQHPGLQQAISDNMVQIVQPIYSETGIRTGFIPIQNEVI